MAVAALDAVLFQNEDWSVTESGLEHRRTGYFIARDELGCRRTDGLWSWPLHMAEKSWCAIPAFTEAFSRAVAAYGVDADAALSHSFHVARHEVAGDPLQQPLSSLHSHPPIPISSLSGQSERSAQAATRSGPPQDRPRQREFLLGSALPQTARARLSHPDLMRAARWRSQRIRRAGTRIVRLLKAAWISG